MAVLASIRRLALLRDGWKGNDSTAPSDRAISDAEQFARIYFEDATMAAPRVGAAADGEINFYWSTANVAIDLSVLGDGTYAYFARRASGAPFLGDKIPIGEPLPAELRALLKAAA